MNHPPVAAFDSNSIVVGNLPIQFEWRSKALEVEKEMNVCRSNDQIMQELNPPRESEMNRGDTLNGRRKGERGGWAGPVWLVHRQSVFTFLHPTNPEKTKTSAVPLHLVMGLDPSC